MNKIEELIAELCPDGVEFKPLGEIAHVLNGYSFKSKNYTEKGIRIIRISDVQKGRVSNKDLKFYPVDISPISQYLLHENDLVMSLTGNVGRVAMLSKTDLPAALNQRVTCIRVKSDKVLIQFLFYFFDQDIFEAEAMRSATGGGQKNLSTKWLKNHHIPIPPLKLQQKIAHCLGSLDDLIAAGGQKLEALRQHKKGLMQQLFPQPNETMPKLRFPEFRDWGKWETRKLGDVISRGKEKFDPQQSHDTPLLIELENIESRTGRILGVAKIEKQKSLKSRFRAGDVLFGKLRPYLQKFARPNFQGVCTSEIWVLRGKEVSSAFLFYLVQIERFIQLANVSSGSRMPRAEWKFLAGADVKIPHPDEQKKIADCLGSLDDLIAAEGRKFEAVRQHKQGLMQQLFPCLETK